MRVTRQDQLGTPERNGRDVTKLVMLINWTEVRRERGGNSPWFGFRSWVRDLKCPKVIDSTLLTVLFDSDTCPWRQAISAGYRISCWHNMYSNANTPRGRINMSRHAYSTTNRESSPHQSILGEVLGAKGFLYSLAEDNNIKRSRVPGLLKQHEHEWMLRGKCEQNNNP